MSGSYDGAVRQWTVADPSAPTAVTQFPAKVVTLDVAHGELLVAYDGSISLFERTDDQ